MRLVIVMALAGCQNGSFQVGLDSDTGDVDIDTSADTDVDTSVADGLTISVDFERSPPPRTRVGVWLARFENGAFGFLREYTGVPATAWPTEVHLDTPEPLDQWPLGGTGPNGAYWFVAAYRDFNANDRHDEGEHLFAASLRVVVYASALDGEPDVWSARELGNGSSIEVDPAEPFDLISTEGEPQITLRGRLEWTNDAAPPDRYATVASSELAGSWLPHRTLDIELGRELEAQLSGPVDPVRVDTSGWLHYAAEIPLAYYDVNHDQHLGAGDQPAAYTCFDGLPVYVTWVAPTGTIQAAVSSVLYDTPSGWAARAWNADLELATVLGPDARHRVLVSPTGCSW